MLHTLLLLALLALLAYLGICAALFFSQRSLLYFPQPSSSSAPYEIWRLGDAELEVNIQALQGQRAVLYFGGNAEDVGLSLPTLAKAFPDQALYLLHYRAYGRSSGRPSESAITADALALFDKVHAEHPQITIVGRSLGSGVAIHVASLRPVARLVLVTPYDSIQTLAAQQFPWVPVRWLLQDKYESWRYAATVTAPTRLITAAHDEVVPAPSTDRLLSRFQPGVATLTRIEGAGHNTIEQSPDYPAALR